MNESSTAIFPEILTTGQAIAYLGGRVAVLHYLRTKGLKPAFTGLGKGGKAHLYRKSTIDLHLDDAEAKNKSGEPVHIADEINTTQPCQENDASSNRKRNSSGKPSRSCAPTD